MYILLTIAVIIILVLIMRITYLALLTKIVGKRTSLYEQHPENHASSLLCVGDSMCIGVGASQPELSLIGNIGKRLPQTKITNKSYLGVTTKELLENLKRQELGEHDAALVMIGGMDIIKRSNLNKLEKTLEELIELLRKHTKGDILLTVPNNTGSLPIYHFPLKQILNSRAAHVQRVFEQKGRAMDCVVIKEGLDMLLGQKRKYFSRDKFHPNDYGYELWCDGIKRYFMLSF